MGDNRGVCARGGKHFCMWRKDGVCVWVRSCVCVCMGGMGVRVDRGVRRKGMCASKSGLRVRLHRVG